MNGGDRMLFTVSLLCLKLLYMISILVRIVKLISLYLDCRSDV